MDVCQSLVWRGSIVEAVEVDGLQYSSKYHHFTSLETLQSLSTQTVLKDDQTTKVLSTHVGDHCDDHRDDLSVILVTECQCGD